MARLLWSEMLKRYVVEGSFRVVVDGYNRLDAKRKARRILDADGIKHVVLDVREEAK